MENNNKLIEKSIDKYLNSDPWKMKVSNNVNILRKTFMVQHTEK